MGQIFTSDFKKIWRTGVRPIYIPRCDMATRVRQFFNEGMDTDQMSGIFGYKESAIERWLHLTANKR